ncbi:DUF4287 domain-containing protein [Kitasatospora sp. NPDC127067]|uniref:DUF4287 domain-containing protein n=1 Tax=Kitasatospora sp. NPDC127067 TaxID=3347126 RepID=UPI003660BDE3
MAIAAVKGPASCFPSIEKKYGCPIEEWKDLIRASPFTQHMELVAWRKAAHLTVVEGPSKARHRGGPSVPDSGSDEPV